MNHPAINTLDQLKYKIFGEAESIDEARDHAEMLLQSSDKHSISEALDYFQNTILNEAIKIIEETRT
jgi:hypothetical protein